MSYRATGFAETFAQDSESVPEKNQRFSRGSDKSTIHHTHPGETFRYNFKSDHSVAPQTVAHNPSCRETQISMSDRTLHVTNSHDQCAGKGIQPESACPPMQHPNPSDPISPTYDQLQTDHERVDPAPCKSTERGVRGS